MSEYGVTSAGFVKKRFDEIYNEVSSDILADLGLDISANPQSVSNVIVATFCDRLARLWDLAESVYNSQFPSTATGVALDNACSYANIQRRVNVPSEYYVLLIQSGSIGLYPVGTQATAVTQNYGTRYMTSTKTVGLQASGGYASYWRFTCPATSGITVSLTMGDTYSTYTTTGDVETDNFNLFATVYQTPDLSDFRFSKAGPNDEVVIKCKDYIPRQIYWSGVQLVEYGVYAPFVDDVPGDVAYTGLVTVTTTNPITRAECETYLRGTDYESDENFRARYLNLITSRGCASVDAIRSQVLMVPGVGACDVKENRLDQQQMGIPGHGIKVYVDVLPGATYDDTEVATAIFNAMSAGIAIATGAHTVYVPDYAGNGAQIYFDDPTTLAVYVQISIAANGTLASDYVTTAQSVFTEMAGTPKMGDAVDLQAIAVAIKNAITGAGYVEVACKYMAELSYDRMFLPSQLGTKYVFSGIVVQTI